MRSHRVLIHMKQSTGCGWAVIAALLTAGLINAQTLTNQSLNGNYYFRYVSIGTDATGNATDPRSLLGTITFDGSGHYTYSGQGVQGSNAPAAQSGSGTYAVDPAGFVTMDSPLRTGDKVNARLGSEALVGSGTESTDNTFDLLVAIPAPAANAALNGPFWTATLEFPGGLAANAHSTIFSMNSTVFGTLATINVSGHAANLAGGIPQAQPVTGGAYTLAGNGSGSISFGTASTSALLSGSRTFYISASGNVILGGSPGSHDILVGVKAVANPTLASWGGNFWSAGLRFDTSDTTPWVDYAASASAAGNGSSTWYKRLKSLGAGASDFTFANPYALNPDGSLAVELTEIGLGANGTFVGVALSSNDTNAYELFFGTRMAAVSGTGVFLNPQGVVNAASSAPSGNPISPGEFITLYGSGMAKSSLTAAPPYPGTLNGVTVTVNGKPAPLYFVSAGQINCLVPYATTGATATIVVQNGNVNSNTVTVPVAAASPGIYSLSESGTGSGAILHADFSLVNASKPAVAGETVQIYLTGMGAVAPGVADGTAGKANPLSLVNAQTTVYIAGQAATVVYNGLAPNFPGLYQIDVTLPAPLPGTGNLPVAIQTPTSFHDQVYIPVM
jgi:uncharacterized protein (TIGR03437 family)